jgi:hypothetical protein
MKQQIIKSKIKSKEQREKSKGRKDKEERAGSKE